MIDRGLHPDDYDCTGDAAAYVLGALNEYEVAPFVRHLDGCAICRDEVSSLQVVADMLPAAVNQVGPPRGLRKRVLATVYDEAARMAAPAAQPSRAAAASGRRAWRPVPRPFQALAAAGLVAAGIAVGTVALRGGPSAQPTRIIQAYVSEQPTTAQLRISAGGRTELAVSELAPPPTGRVYEVWLQRKGQPQPTDALFTPTADGRATVAVPGGVDGVDAVLVTDEPNGGSTTPTRSPVIRASLQ